MYTDSSPVTLLGLTQLASSVLHDLYTATPLGMLAFIVLAVTKKMSWIHDLACSLALSGL